MEITIIFGVEGVHQIEWIIGLYKNLYGLKDSGLPWFERSSKVWTPENFSGLKWIHVYGREEMVLLFYVDNFLMFIPYNDTFYGLYTSLQAGFKI